jgi:hypothetical protein
MGKPSLSQLQKICPARILIRSTRAILRSLHVVIVQNAMGGTVEIIILSGP